MTRALVWKELREQWAVCLTLAVAAAVAVAGAVGLMDIGRNRDETLVAVLWLSAWGYGLVCGALLLAGEAEDDTQPFLDALPTSRRKLWRVKALAGLVLVAGQSAALAPIGVALSIKGGWSAPTKFALAGLPCCGAVGFAWGLCGGASAASVLGGIVRGVVLQALAALAAIPATAIALKSLFGAAIEPYGKAFWPGMVGILAAGAAVRSRVVFCRSDRARSGPTRRGRWVEAIRRSAGERKKLAFGLALLQLLGIMTSQYPGDLWSHGTALLVGLIAGVTVCVGVRPPDAPGLPVERRVLSRIGAVHFLTAVGTVFLVPTVSTALWTLATGSGHPVAPTFTNRRVSFADPPLGPTLLNFLPWVVYGFSAGTLGSVAVRRSLPAAVVALAVAVPLLAEWVGAVFTGGRASAGVVWGVPAAQLAAAWLLMRSRGAPEAGVRRQVA